MHHREDRRLLHEAVHGERRLPEGLGLQPEPVHGLRPGVTERRTRPLPVGPTGAANPQAHICLGPLALTNLFGAFLSRVNFTS